MSLELSITYAVSPKPHILKIQSNYTTIAFNESYTLRFKNASDRQYIILMRLTRAALIVGDSLRRDVSRRCEFTLS